MSHSNLLKRAWSVGWAPFGVLALHSVLAVLFGHRREWDPLFHFLGGAAGAYSLLRILNALPGLARAVEALDRSAVIVVAMSTACLLWELAEFASDRFLGTRIQQGLFDTGSDVALGVVGAAVTAWVARIAVNRVNVDFGQQPDRTSL